MAHADVAAHRLRNNSVPWQRGYRSFSQKNIAINARRDGVMI
jgi:hypothetical protein